MFLSWSAMGRSVLEGVSNRVVIMYLVLGIPGYVPRFVCC